MRKLGTFSGLMILLFIIIAMRYYPDDSTKVLLSFGAMFITVAMIVTKLRPGKQKTKGYVLRG